MKSKLPKVLHPVCGRPMVHWVIAAARDAGAERGRRRHAPGRGVAEALPDGTVDRRADRGRGDGLGGARRARPRRPRLDGDRPLRRRAADQRRADRRARRTHTRTRRRPRRCSRPSELDPTGYGRIVRAARRLGRADRRDQARRGRAARGARDPRDQHRHLRLRRARAVRRARRGRRDQRRALPDRRLPADPARAAADDRRAHDDRRVERDGRQHARRPGGRAGDRAAPGGRRARDERRDVRVARRRRRSTRASGSSPTPRSRTA